MPRNSTNSTNNTTSTNDTNNATAHDTASAPMSEPTAANDRQAHASSPTPVPLGPYVTAHVRVVERTEKTPAKKQADAWLEFHWGDLAGTAFTGFTIWTGHTGAYVSPPARSWEGDNGKRTFSYVRPVDPNLRGLPASVGQLILDEYARVLARMNATTH